MRSVWRRAWWWLPVLVAVCVSLPKIGQGDWRVDMGRYAAIGYESWTRIFEGDLSGLYALTEAKDPSGEPTVPYFNKPPLPLLVHGLTLHATGRNMWGTRLPAVAALAVVVLFTCLTARSMLSRRAALTAGLIAATSLPLVGQARAISLDLWQLVFIQAGVWLVAAGARLRGDGPPRGSLAAAGGAVIAGGLLCKPLVALLIVPMLAAWLVCVGRSRLIGPLLGGLAAGLLIPLAWYVAAYAHWGRPFIDEHFGRQIVKRAQGKLDNLREGSSSPFFYVLELVEGYWPWMLTVALGLWAYARGRLRTPRERAAACMGVVIGLSWLVLCSAFADKRPRYILPVYPAWAVLSAVWVHGAAPRWTVRVRRLGVRWAAPVAVLGAVGVSLLPVTIHGPASPRWERVIGFAGTPGLPPIYGAGLEVADRCRYFLRLGRWPSPLTRDKYTLIGTPRAGGLILYDTRSGWRPGLTEVPVLSAGEYTITWLVAVPWAPVRPAGSSDDDG